MKLIGQFLLTLIDNKLRQKSYKKKLQEKGRFCKLLHFFIVK